MKKKKKEFRVTRLVGPDVEDSKKYPFRLHEPKMQTKKNIPTSLVIHFFSLFKKGRPYFLD